jgi:hypothetical protein
MKDLFKSFDAKSRKPINALNNKTNSISTRFEVNSKLDFDRDSEFRYL